ncbi:MAG: tRNA pseudouridine synthase A [Thermoplasmata archaeon]
MTVYLIKFAYDGTKFDAFSMEKNRKTVEGEILKVTRAFNISDRIYISSRTDRNVSALGNVIGLISKDEIKKIAGILNSKLPFMLFYSYTVVDDRFKPRHALERWYRYFLLDQNFNLDDMKKKAELFIGEHDFSLFSRKDDRNTLRKISNIEIEKDHDLIVIDIWGQSFLWNMVRRIVGFLAYGKGNPFTEGSKFNVPAENLLLMDVSYGFEFNYLKTSKSFYEYYWTLRSLSFLYGEISKIAEGRWGIEPH